MKIAVIDMGKIGLPLAVQYAQKGHDVIGVDINSKTVELINMGLEPFPEEENLQKYLEEVINLQKLRATLSYREAVSEADVIVVVVPLFVNEKTEPDYSAIDSATMNIGRSLKRNTLICYETTLPIGTTRERFVPLLEYVSGFRAGEDFSVVFSPERVFTGRIFQDLRKYPKIVGGFTETCSKKGVDFYEQVLDFDERQDLTRTNGVWNVNSTESAEFVKLAETTYRDVNIGLANQFAMYADSIGENIYEIIEAANSQHYSHIHQPGISVGGHCIPIYPQFYLWKDQNASVVREARKTNQSMPKYVVNKISSMLGNIEGKKVLILGVSYRTKVKEVAFSGVFDLVRFLCDLDAEVECYDPLFQSGELIDVGLTPMTTSLGDFDIIILHTPHDECIDLLSQNNLGSVLIYDGRNALQEKTSDYARTIMTLGSTR